MMPEAKVSLKVIQSADQEGALDMDAPEYTFLPLQSSMNIILLLQ